MTSRRPLGLQKLHVTRGSASHWKRGHRVTSRPGGGARRLQRAGHVFQEAARPLLRAHSGRGIIAPYWPKDATKRHLLFAVTVGLPLAGLSGPVTCGCNCIGPNFGPEAGGVVEGAGSESVRAGTELRKEGGRWCLGRLQTPGKSWE